MNSETPPVTLQSDNIVNLTDGDIQQLLTEAERRLRKDTGKPANDLTTLDRPEQALPHMPKLSSGSSLGPYVRQNNDLAVINTTRTIDPMVNNGKQSLTSEQKAPKSAPKKNKPTAGADWFDLPKTELTPDLKRDLQLLRMRSILDPKRHYKKENGKAQLPKYSEVGTIIEGPTEFFSGRISKRDRKKTFVEEALVLEKETKRFETRYNDVQYGKRSGKKSFYNNLRAKRKTGKNRG
ncbi:Fcf2 pre-rRNA processing-domain-containing protein [Aspergillus aurantiobrunneus]